MPDYLISELPDALALAITDFLELEQGTTPSNASGKVTIGTVISFINDRNYPRLVAITPVDGIATLDLNYGANKNFTLTVGANLTLNVINPPVELDRIVEFELEIRVTGSFTLTLPASFSPLGGSDTTIPTINTSRALLSAKSFDQGTYWHYAMQGPP